MLSELLFLNVFRAANVPYDPLQEMLKGCLSIHPADRPSVESMLATLHSYLEDTSGFFCLREHGVALHPAYYDVQVEKDVCFGLRSRAVSCSLSLFVSLFVSRSHSTVLTLSLQIRLRHRHDHNEDEGKLHHHKKKDKKKDKKDKESEKSEKSEKSESTVIEPTKEPRKHGGIKMPHSGFRLGRLDAFLSE